MHEAMKQRPKEIDRRSKYACLLSLQVSDTIPHGREQHHAFNPGNRDQHRHNDHYRASIEMDKKIDVDTVCDSKT